MVSMDDDGPYRGKSAFSRARDRISKSATNAREADFGKRKGGSKAEVAAGLEKSEARKAERRDRSLDGGAAGSRSHSRCSSPTR